VVSIFFVVSALGAMNGSVLTAARVPYAMAHEKLFFRQLGFLNEKTHVPMVSVILQGILSVIMAFLGTFNELTDYTIFASWLFYLLVAAAVFVFRKKLPNHPRPYKVWGYPFIPIIFIVIAAVLIGNTVIEMPKQSLTGIGLILLGVPVYYLFRNRWKAHSN
jgi:APA family basic amino acid/polyamine antiporter